MTVRGKSIDDGSTIDVDVRDGVIVSVSRAGESNAAYPYVSPGFIDMQVNGYNGSDYSLADLDEEHVRALVLALARSGVTQHVPTFVSLPEERLLRNLRLVADLAYAEPGIAAAICGFHVEGPFISPKDGARGAHDRGFIRKADFDEFLRWQSAARGMIAYVTIAPEAEGAMEFIGKAVNGGVKVALGHSEADPDLVKAAIEAGASLSTHLGNGSPNMIPRLRNFLWPQLAADGLFAGMICDGFHLPAEVVKVFARAKGDDRLILVSDAALIGGYAPGLYRWGDLSVQVFDDGHLGLPGTTILAGAAHLLDWDIARFMEFTGLPLATSIKLCTKNPARYLGLAGSGLGSLEAGAPANLCLFRYTPGDRALSVQKTMRRGEWIYSSS